MRPEQVRQRPHHFIRRWPRAKRLLRGPDEIFRVYTSDKPTAAERGLDMAGQAKRDCPKGWKFVRDRSGVPCEGVRVMFFRSGSE